MPRIKCPKCFHKKGYRLGDGRRKCAGCGHRWSANSLPLHLTIREWKCILRWFLRQQSARIISEETGLERRRIMRALLLVREAMKTDVPEQFSGIVEVDETYIGGQWKNKKKRIRGKGTKRGRGTSKQPVFGIYARNGIVWAELVDDAKSETLHPLITRQVKSGSTVCSDTWKGYTGIATKGYVHRLVDHKKEFVNGKAHINGLEGFWGYLKRRLAAKGGIRRERQGLYLAEYVWRYNNRKLSIDDQVRKLMALLRSGRLVGPETGT